MQNKIPTKKLRVLLISPYFYPHFGGSQRYMEELYYNLMKTNPNVRVDVLCYNTDSSPAREKYRGFNIYRVPCIQILPGQFAVPNYLKLKKILKELTAKYNYSFIHANTRFFESSWWAPFLAKRINARSILTDHCAFHPQHQSKLIKYVALLIDKFFVPYFLRKYNLVIATNKSTANFIEKLVSIKPLIIYGGVDTHFFRPKGSETSDNGIVVSFVGRMIESKGPQILLHVAEKILRERPDVSFLFAGDGPMLNKLKQRNNGKVSFLGSLEKKQIAARMKKSDIPVHPSFHNEGFPNVLLEAGASGCAVISTNQGGSGEIIIHNQTGLLIEPTVEQITYHLTALIENSQQRQALGKALRQRIQEHFTWDNIIKEFQKILY